MINSLPPKEVSAHQLLFALQNINNNLTGLRAEQDKMADRLRRLETETQGLRKAWDTAGALVKVIKVFAALALGLAAIWGSVEGLLLIGRSE